MSFKARSFECISDAFGAMNIAFPMTLHTVRFAMTVDNNSGNWDDYGISQDQYLTARESHNEEIDGIWPNHKEFSLLIF